MAKSKIPERVSYDNMNDTERIQHLKDENEHLRTIVRDIEEDSRFNLLFACNRKNNEMARVLNRSVISLEDKSIENYQKMVKGMKDTLKVTQELFDEYLHLDENGIRDTAKEIEEKGTPLIEQRATKSK